MGEGQGREGCWHVNMPEDHRALDPVDAFGLYLKCKVLSQRSGSITLVFEEGFP